MQRLYMFRHANRDKFLEAGKFDDLTEVVIRLMGEYIALAEETRKIVIISSPERCAYATADALHQSIDRADVHFRKTQPEIVPLPLGLFTNEPYKDYAKDFMPFPHFGLCEQDLRDDRLTADTSTLDRFPFFERKQYRTPQTDFCNLRADPMNVADLVGMVRNHVECLILVSHREIVQNSVNHFTQEMRKNNPKMQVGDMRIDYLQGVVFDYKEGTVAKLGRLTYGKV